MPLPHKRKPGILMDKIRETRWQVDWRALQRLVPQGWRNRQVWTHTPGSTAACSQLLLRGLKTDGLSST